MRLNHKLEELVEGVVSSIRKKYPETQLVEITESPENPDTLWVCVTAPDDEEREIELRSFAAEKCTDVLCDYGYHILVMPIY
ncbi:MAG TPA: hypothetical protein ENK58_03085 [Desulfobacterales bacterium]|nr:MAG: hypothetical protein DRI57_04635 [Deltaproteobacteria bacterium]HHC24387.1 hypothetical protein [Desulfobacterales bacterium]